jgi:hypothetical protein
MLVGGYEVSIFSAQYGNTGYRIIRSGIQNPIDFWLKVKCSKGFFDINILKLNYGEPTKFGANFYKLNFFKHDL